MADNHPAHVGTCPTCGKRCYPTRKIARRTARRYQLGNLSAYRCGNTWHLGHLPTVVRRGRLTRDQLTTKEPPP